MSIRVIRPPGLYTTGGVWNNIAIWYTDAACTVHAWRLPNATDNVYVMGNIVGSGIAHNVFVGDLREIGGQLGKKRPIGLYTPGGAWDDPAIWYLDADCTKPAGRVPTSSDNVYVLGSVSGTGEANNIVVGDLTAVGWLLAPCGNHTACTASTVEYTIEIPGTNLVLSGSFLVSDEWGYESFTDPADPTYNTYIVAAFQITFDPTDPCGQWNITMYLCYLNGNADSPGHTEMWQGKVASDLCDCPQLGEITITTETESTANVSLSIT